MLIERAKIGVYNASSLRFVLHSIKVKYFIPIDKGKYRIINSIKEWVIFKHHNLLEDPPLTRMNLVLYR